MANVAYGPYSPTTWVDNVTDGNHVTLNNLEGQCKVALHGFNPDLFTPFVETGMVCTKDGTFANQLDVTAGTAYLTMTDGTLSLITTSASVASQFLTSAASTTYHLYLQPDGTWYWNTANSPQSNSLFIAQVTTDGSSNILTVTDERTLSTTLLNNFTSSNGAAIFFNADLHFGGNLFGTGGFVLVGDKLKLANPIIETTQSGGANGFTFETWNGSANKVPFSVGGQFNSSLAYIDNNGNLFVHAAVNSISGTLVLESEQSGSASGVTLESWSGSANVVPFSVGGQFNSALSWVDGSGNYNGGVATGIPSTRNGAATSAPIYTGTSTPSSPPTGSIWIKA